MINKRTLTIMIMTGIFCISSFAQYKLDKSFNSNGLFTGNPFNGGSSQALTSEIERLPDGSYLVVGSAAGFIPNGFTMVIQKFSANGVPDLSFGGGDSHWAFPLNSLPSEGHGIVLLPDGKILIAGATTISVPGTTGVPRETLVRLNANGTIDTTFDEDGYVIQPHQTNPLFDVGTVAYDVELLSTGEIVTAGQYRGRQSDPIPCADGFNPRCSTIAKYTTGGDEIFRGFYDIGADNMMNPLNEALVDIEIDSNDNIVGAISNGSAENDFSVVRFSSIGVVDPSFGVSGVSRTSNHFGQTSLIARNVEIQTDGKIVLTGQSNGLITARFNTDGQLDSTYGTNGKTPAISTTSSRAIHGDTTVITEDGRILSNGARNELVRLNSDGSPDTTFGIDGVLKIEVPGENPTTGHTADLIIEPNGDIAFTSQTSLLGVGEGPVDQWHVGRLRPAPARFDFDGDNKADISVFRPSAGEWWYLRSSDDQDSAFAFGSPTDVPVPADFTGDGIADFSFWRQATGEWFVLRSDNTGFFSFPFGASGDIPAPGDFDGDGTDDAAVFRPSSGTWFILNSSDGQTQFVPFGAPTDKPLVGDYDGDGTDDVAIYKPDVAQFWQLRSTEGQRAFAFGAPSDIAMTADFSGDGSDDMVQFRPSTGFWFVLRSEDSDFFGFPFGASGDIPAAADYDGDGTADATVFRPTDTTWYSQQSTNGAVFTPFGIAGDEPVPGVYNSQ